MTDDWSVSLDELAASDYAPTTAYIGYLKQLGLDYGWGPTAFVETLLEHVHVYADTPWWCTILLTALLVRAALFRFNLKASDHSAKLALAQHLTKPITERMKAARVAEDQVAMMAAATELKEVYKKTGFKILGMMGPFLQIPLGYGTFRLMRGMANLPVPGLDTGGFLWVKDLTVSDPYLLLPVVTALLFHLSVKVCDPENCATSFYS